MPNNSDRSGGTVFYGNHLLFASTVMDRQAFMTLDTEVETTDLNENFARQFAREVQEAGTTDTTSVSGNIGLDLLLQSGTVTIDFSRMRLRIR